MKIPKPISEAEYERQLARYVHQIEEAAKPRLRVLNPNSRLARVLAIFRSSKVPLSAAEALIGAGADPADVWRMGSCAQFLMNYGWIRRAGTRTQAWGYGKRMASHEVHLYEAVDPPPECCYRPATFRIAQILERVEFLNLRRLASRCLAPRVIVSAEVPRLQRFRRLTDRDTEIMRRRLAGEELQRIGDDFGITRERVRQIFERLVRATTTEDLARLAKEHA